MFVCIFVVDSVVFSVWMPSYWYFASNESIKWREKVLKKQSVRTYSRAFRSRRYTCMLVIHTTGRRYTEFDNRLLHAGMYHNWSSTPNAISQQTAEWDWFGFRPPTIMSSHQWLRIILHRSMSTLAAQTSSHLALCAEEQHESYGAPLFRFRRFLLEQIRQQYAETCIHIDNNMLRRVSTSTAICRDVYLHDVYILHIKRIYTFQRNPGPRLTNPQNLRYQ